MLIFAVMFVGQITVHAEIKPGPPAVKVNDVLLQIQQAARVQNYTGTFVYQQEAQVRASKITHVFIDEDEIEKIEMLDGARREYVRHNQEVMRYFPSSKTILIEKRFSRDIFPAILVANPNELAQYYRVAQNGMQRVAEKTCHEVTLLPIDKWRYGYRLCIEDESHLLLRVQTLDNQQHVIEQMLFTQLTIGKLRDPDVKPSFDDLHDWHVQRAESVESVNLPEWEVTPPLGFKQIQAIKHELGPSLRGQAGKSLASKKVKRDVFQLVYSDGLAAISVFISPDNQTNVARNIRQGAMHIMGRRFGSYWVTVMGEAPELSIRQMINSIELLY
jgi:sigma-E factor negative regulatory protein RseB